MLRYDTESNNNLIQLQSHPLDCIISTIGLLSLNQLIVGFGFPFASQNTKNLSPILAM